MTEIKTFVFNPFQVNTYILYQKKAEGFIIDAACQEAEELKQVIDFIEQENIKIKGIINTHCHVDHLLGVEDLRKYFNTEFYCSEKDQFLIDSSEAQGEYFGLRVNKPSFPDKYLTEKDRLFLNGAEIEVLHIPGHSPGSVVFYLRSEKFLFSGDVLFSGSIGRTDLPGGDYNALVEGIKKKMLVLDDDVEVFPGHGPSTTIGNERLLNPFLQ